MRLTFLDESGRSRHEPIIVVAGVIIHGDRVYRKLEDRLRKIVAEAVPEHDRRGLILHATHLFHGNGYFDRKTWSREKRLAILSQVASLPAEFSLPVVFGHLIKEEYKHDAQVERVVAAQVVGRKDVVAHKHREHVLDIAEHMVAFTRAEIAVERQMHEYPRDEICMLIAEDTDRVKQALRVAHAFLSDPEQIDGSEFEGLRGLPLRKIVDTPHFAEKAHSPPLQVADVCAFLIMRRLMKREESQELFELIAPQLFWGCVDFGEQMGTEQIGGGRLY